MKQALSKTYMTFKAALPIILGVLLLISLIDSLSEGIYSKIFTGNFILDPLVGAIAGALSFGIPVTSFVAAGELMKQGVSLIAVTAFILTWSTVGTTLLPMEIMYLGKRFAISRNILNFFLSIIVAMLIVLTYKALS